jgi:hypothetical protein
MNKSVVNNPLIFLSVNLKSENLIYAHSFGELLKEHNNKFSPKFVQQIKKID